MENSKRSRVRKIKLERDKAFANYKFTDLSMIREPLMKQDIRKQKESIMNRCMEYLKTKGLEVDDVTREEVEMIVNMAYGAIRTEFKEHNSVYLDKIGKLVFRYKKAMAAYDKMIEKTMWYKNSVEGMMVDPQFRQDNLPRGFISTVDKFFKSMSVIALLRRKLDSALEWHRKKKEQKIKKGKMKLAENKDNNSEN